MKYPTLLMYNVVDEGILLFDPVIDVYNGDINGRGIFEACMFIALEEKKYITDRKLEAAKNATDSTEEANNKEDQKKKLIILSMELKF